MKNMPDMGALGGTPEKKKNALKLEHLKEGVKPIMMCLGTHDQFIKNPVLENNFFKKKWNA